jgi:uncharacterized membrane protein YgcG
MLRFLRHVTATRSASKRKFSVPVLDAIETAVRESEAQHGGEIRFAVEASLPPSAILAGISPRERALQVFAQLHVWDTHANNGVLIYVLMADRQVEIVADRGFNGLVAPAEWEQICQVMEQSFARGDYRGAASMGIGRVGDLMRRHFPAVDGNEQSDRPIVL